jgi:hypothetical protein
MQDDTTARLKVGKVTITKGHPETDNWLSGYLTRSPDYTFAAKVFDLGNEYGIQGGRISKLEVRHQGKIVMNYDRAWDKQPGTWKHKAVLKEIVESFRNSDPLSAKTQRGIRPARGF